MVCTESLSQIEAARASEVRHAAATEAQMRRAREEAAAADKRHYENVRSHGLVQEEEVPLPRSHLPAALAGSSQAPAGRPGVPSSASATGATAGFGYLDPGAPASGADALAAVGSGEALLASQLLDK